MDVRLPGEDGFTLTRYLRAHHKVGVIILTTRHETVDRVVGLECGADDYVIKPFEERELLARIRSVLRRTGAGGHASSSARQSDSANSHRLNFQDCSVDENANVFRSSSGASVSLTTKRRFAASWHSLFVTRAGPQSREALTEAVLQRRWGPMDRSIDVLITRLRHKIEIDPKRPAIIKTVRSIGYVVTSATDVLAGTAA